MAEPGLPVHGGSDGAPVRCDFSTNANPLGPGPVVVEALRAVDPWPYPDPSYRALRVAIADRHGCDPEAVVPGAGACELIHRVVRLCGGPVAVREPCFGEYGHAAAVAGSRVIGARDDAAFAAALTRAGVGFVTSPNNPDGRVWSPADVEALEGQATAPVVADLAFAPLSQVQIAVPAGAWTLHAPNKAHGITGVRAGYLVADVGCAVRLREGAPSWVLGAHGVAALHATLTPAADGWVRESRATLWAWRDRLADRLGDLGLPVTASPANFLLTDVGDASAVASRLRARGLKVRDCASFGLPRHLRLAARSPADQDTLLTALHAEVATWRR